MDLKAMRRYLEVTTTLMSDEERTEAHGTIKDNTIEQITDLLCMPGCSLS